MQCGKVPDKEIASYIPVIPIEYLCRRCGSGAYLRHLCPHKRRVAFVVCKIYKCIYRLNMDLMLQDNIVSEGITSIVRAAAAAMAAAAAAAVAVQLQRQQPWWQQQQQ